MAKLRIGALEMAARIGGNTIIVHPLAVHHVSHRDCAPFILLLIPIRIAPNEKGGLFRSEPFTVKIKITITSLFVGFVCSFENTRAWMI
jgi:hypothetical protein